MASVKKKSYDTLYTDSASAPLEIKELVFEGINGEKHYEVVYNEKL